MPGIAARKSGMPTLEASWVHEAGDFVVDVRPMPLSRRVACGLGSGRLVALSASDGQTVWGVDAHQQGLVSMDVSATGDRIVTGGQDRIARLFDAEGRSMAELPGTKGWIESVALQPAGGLVACASGNRVRIWGEGGQPVLETEPSESTVTGVAWSPDGRSLATSCYGGVRVWPVLDGGGSKHLPFKGSLISVSWSPDGRVVASGSQDCLVHFWRMNNGKDSEMSGYPSKPRVLAWTPDGSQLITSGAPEICLWSFTGKGPEGSKPEILKAHDGLISALAVSPSGGWLASGSTTGEVRLWRLGKGRKPSAGGDLDGEVTSLRWSPDGRALYGACAGGRIVRWDIESSTM